MFIHNNQFHWRGFLLCWLCFSLVAMVMPVKRKPIPPVLLGEVVVVGRLPEKERAFTVSATVYYPTGDPTYDGTTIVNKAIAHLNWCAVSHDLLAKCGWKMGDTLLVRGGQLPTGKNGLYVLHDLTHKRLRNRVDLLVPTGSFSDRWDSVSIRKFTINEL